ncbi:Centrosomin N-terminal motif 1 [Teratosphaeria destructans]|uniref:Centrosomin N-terminal motif 1 n=1 Tax=Teratosphaeria destructans TaxID=418781 RepID=A0A9W7SL78_9PEZI|nr:Centrosomin N-terminal motif 1 [Teratosphaeria destructans]
MSAPDATARPGGEDKNNSHDTSSPAAPSPERARRKPKKLERRSQKSIDEGRASVPLEVEVEVVDAMMRDHTDHAEHRLFEQGDDELDDLPIFLKQQQQQPHPGHYIGGNDNYNDIDAADEEDAEMRRHFMDVESSFLPDYGMAAQHTKDDGRLGADDTYLELGKPGRTPPPDLAFGSAKKNQRRAEEGEEPETPLGAYKTPAPGRPSDAGGEEHEEGEEEDNSVSRNESVESPSSPAAAAAQRGHARNISTATVTRNFSGHRAQHSTDSGGSRPTSAGRPVSKSSTIRPGSSPHPENVALPVSEAPSMISLNGSLHALPPSRLSARPSHLGNRNASQHSSISSATLSSGYSSEAGDYALQTGGAMSASTMLESSRAGMGSRMPSLGSVVSYSEGIPSFSRGISGTVPLSRLGSRLDGVEEERLQTPRANTDHSNFQAPTDTVLAQRVESIQVPETIARDFRAKNRSPERPQSAGGLGVNFPDRPRRTLTLKEQNSKIDKLTKENFELKLKIHFLDQALQARSDDGVKELIDKNVQFQTDLANERKETQGLRRKIRELERKMQEQDEAMMELRQQKASSREDRDEDDDPTLQAEMHEEILYLRQQLDHSENQVTTLREEVMTKELEKRKMAEHMRSMAGTRGEDTAGMKETMEMWQDLLNAETGRREQAEEDIRRLREELTALRIEHASPSANKVLRRRSRPGTGYDSMADSDHTNANGMNGSATDSSATLVEHLKHENAELRRDLGAQTSMLTSRNRERERLQQEIEDLKLLTRKSDGGARSLAGESIFERSISRAHQRPQSRGSDHTHVTQATDAQLEDWERKEGQLRDQNAELRLKYQDLERTHNTHLQYVAALEGDFEQMETELTEQAEDLRLLQTERDEALHAFEDKEQEFQKLEDEAVNEIDRLTQEVQSLESELEEAHKKHQKVQQKLEHTTDGYKGLQGELRDITQSVMNLEDEKQANMRTIQTLENQIAEAEDEIQKWEQKCKELDQKNRKLEITQESLQSEITFLREEQEGDKIKIGELEDALNAAQQTIQDEQEKLKEMEESIVEERQQRDTLENKSKEEVQKVLDDLNIESGKTKDEVRKLRRALSAKEVEASSWKQKLDELEQALRNMLGQRGGTKQTLLAEIGRVQRQLETTANQLDRSKMEAADKDRLLRHRDGLLESTSLESRRLSDLLDKERASRKHDLDQFEKASRGQATHMRELAQYQSRVLELETAFSQDKRKMASLEQQYKDQLNERNTLLLALWNRLSTLCGSDWARNHGSVNGEAPSIPAIQDHLGAFNRNVISAVKTIEALIGSFKMRIRNVEKALWRDYQTLEENLNLRVKKMEILEKAVVDQQRALQAEREARPQLAARNVSGKNVKGSEEIAKLKSEVKLLKSELKFHRQHPSPMAQQMIHQQNSQIGMDHLRRMNSGGSNTVSQSSPGRAIAALLRHQSTSAVEPLQRRSTSSSNDVHNLSAPGSSSGGPPNQMVMQSQPIQPSEQRWVHRLKELERRLKAEREARLLDRRGARQRLEEGRLENEELRLMLEREKVRRGSVGEGSVAGSERTGADGLVEMEG